jgi:hypothetical protein
MTALFPVPDGLDGLDGLADLGVGSQILDAVHEFGCRYVAFPNEAAAVAWTLWVGHTHLIHHFDSTPRLAVISAEKQSGKTRLLEVTETVVPRPLRSASVTAAVIFRSIGTEDPPTILIDEADTIWNAKSSNEDLRSLANAGHRRGSEVHRMNMSGNQAVKEVFKTFAPMALAGIRDLPDTVMDRSVVLRMRRRGPDEYVDRWRARYGESEGRELFEQLSSWAASITYLELPGDDLDISDRLADVWEPLFAVADAAGEQWPARARQACKALNEVAEDLSPGVRLLSDIRSIWSPEDEFLPTQKILNGLYNLDESPWGADGDFRPSGISALRLANMLKPYGIAPGHSDNRNIRGYHRSHFLDAWDRYLPSAEPSDPSSPSYRTKSGLCNECGEATWEHVDECIEHNYMDYGVPFGP